MSNDHEWLNLVEVSGPFLAVPVLREVFPQGLEALPSGRPQRLRRTYEEWRDAVDMDDLDLPALHAAWIDDVLVTALEMDETVLRKGATLPEQLTVLMPEHGVTVAPDLAVVNSTNSDESLLLIHVYEPDTDLDATRRFDGLAITPADRMVALLRATGCPTGIVTNGERWMLVHAPVDAVAGFASWYARLWGQEPETLRAFVSLLGVRRFFGPEEGKLPALYERSLKYQDDVTEALGEQVRRAVEVLVQALDRADQDRNRELLRDVDPRELYEAGLTVMMRLVFLLAAEERALLLLGDPRYDSFYAISSLRMQLRADPEEILERRRSAWSRLLALFRGVYGGIDHPTLRLPALGGSLFDPDRYPFLEGRRKGTSWRSDPAEPLPIDDRTVLLLLEAIQTLEGRILSYRALDVEQIGHVYEGLLERTVKRVDDVTLELESSTKAKSPRVTLGEIESARLDGQAKVAELLKERSERSESAIQNALERASDDRLAARLLTVCRGDLGLRDRILPYAPLLRTDPWGYPLVHHKGAFVVVLGTDRRESGTHYTPKSLTEKIVTETLTPVAYRGPAEGKAPEEWDLKSAEELLDLKICDPAMGSGAFLVQACRWLSDRLVEAWSVTEARGKQIDSEGRIVEDATAEGFDPIAQDVEERAVVARRLVAERCLYGVDKNPLAVELAKLSLWLTTMSKGRPFGFLDHNLRSGDSLLGIHDVRQLTELSMTPKGSKQLRLFGGSIEAAVKKAIELRTRLRSVPIRDIRDVEAMASLNTQSRGELTLPTLIANALVGIFLAEERASSRAAKVETLAALVDATTSGDHSAKSRIRKEAETDLARDTSDRNARRPFHWPLEFPEVFSERGFDVIVGNPPYIAYYGRDSQATGAGLFERFAERHLSQIDDLVAISGRINTFLLFLVRSIQHSPNAWCAMVLPDTVVANHSYAPMRLALTQLRRIKHVIQFKGTIFRNVTVGTAIVIIGPPTGPEEIRLTVVEEDGAERTFVDRATDVLARTSCSWLATTTQEIRRASPPQNGTILLSELAHVRDGINPGPKSTRAHLLTDRDDGTPTLRRCMEGGWITPFLITVRDLWVHYDQNRLSPAEKKAGASLREAWIFDSPKIVYRQTAPRIVAAVDNERMCALNSVHCIVLKVHNDVVLYALLAYLNSSFMLNYYQAATGETRKVFPQVHARSVKSLLVPRVLADADASVTRQLSTLARSISQIVGGSPTIPKDQASTDMVVARIDKIVEELIATLWTSSSSGSGGAEALNNQTIEARKVPSTTFEPCEGGRLANAQTAEAAEPSASVQERTGQSAAGNYGVVSGRLNEPARAILSYLQRVPGWHGKADILAYVAMPNGQWNAAISDLLARGIVERRGQRRGARYRIAENN